MHTKSKEKSTTHDTTCTLLNYAARVTSNTNNPFSSSMYWCVLDGADCNRQFIKLHFADSDPVAAKRVTRNPYEGESMVFIMDCKVSLIQ